MIPERLAQDNQAHEIMQATVRVVEISENCVDAGAVANLEFAA